MSEDDRIRLKVGGLEQLGQLQGHERDRVRKRIVSYAADPMAAHHDVVKISGSERTYRLRVGDWRVVFTLNGDYMTVLRISHRREVYR